MKKYLILLLVLFTSGCSLVGEVVENAYEDSRSVKKDQGFMNKEGWYAVKVPGDNYFMQEDKNGIVFIPKGEARYYEGNYFLYTYDRQKLPASIGEDLTAGLDWLNENLFRKKVGIKAEILKTAPRNFQNFSALYFEMFVPEKVSNSFGMTVIDRPAFGYAGLVLIEDKRMFIIYHSDPVAVEQAVYTSGQKVPPAVDKMTVDRFEYFLKGVLINPPRQ